MSDLIKHYTDIIYMQSRLLTDCSQVYMNLGQRKAIENVNAYTQELIKFLNNHEQTHPHLTEESMRHELINLLTPIVGYVDMLADEWIGSLNPEQFQHVDLIYQNVHSLQQYVLSQRFKVELSISA